MLVPNSTLKQRVLATMHSSPLFGHSGFQKIYARARHSFFWEGMKKDIFTFVVECDTCQPNKGEIVKDTCPLQPLPISPTPWTDISMDFNVGLPKDGTKSVIMVVVDPLPIFGNGLLFSPTPFHTGIHCSKNFGPDF